MKFSWDFAFIDERGKCFARQIQNMILVGET
jgi:hypothetical protein